MVEHVLLELRTGRDSERNADATMQILSSLPILQDKLYHRLISINEHLSFEIELKNQLINFYIYCPLRLEEYIKSLILANYPEALVVRLQPDQDGIDYYLGPPPTLDADPEKPGVPASFSFAYLDLKYGEAFPLKDYREFGEADSLAPLLSVLSKAKADQSAHIQIVIRDTKDFWKTKVRTARSLQKSSSSETLDSALKDALTKSSREGNMEAKLKEKGLNVAFRLAVSSASKSDSRLFLESIFHAFRTTSKEDSNYFTLKWIPALVPFKTNFLRAFKKRTFATFWHFHLTIYEIATLWHLPNKTLSTIPNISWGKNLLGEPPTDLPIVKKEFDPELKRQINVFAQTSYKNEMVRYGIERADRRRHMYVIGKTGTGKSTMLSNMAINDLRNNEGFCFIDPHGDAIDTLLDYIPAHRINDVVYFNPADGERTVKINLFEGKNIEHRELIASGIVAIFYKLYAYTWGPRLEHFLRNALLTLLQSEEAKMSDIIRLFTDDKWRKKVVEELQDPILKAFWEGEYEPLLPKQKTEAIAPILNKVGQFVSSPLVRNVVNSSKSSFSIEDIMDEGKILLVNLSQGRLGEDNATLLGAMMITKIQLAAMGRVNTPEEKRRDFYLYVDEFQNFATNSFTKILSEARKYRLSLILANQYIAQIDEEVRNAIFGNCGTMVSFVMGSDDATFFSKEYGDKYSIDDLISLNRHQIINRISIDNMISRPFPAWTLPLAKNANHNREKVIRVSRERYASNRTS